MTPTRFATLATISAAATLALAACGNNAEDAAPADATAAETSAMAPAPAAGGETMVGGVAMSPSDTIVANASKAPNLSTLVAAVTAADLGGTLSGAGPFTVFAPDNAAFDKVPADTRSALLAPAGKADLTKILTYHVVPGRLTAADIASQAQAAGGTATLTTVQGEQLKVSAGPNNSWVITDAKGGRSTITQADVAQSNGMVHVIDTVLMP